MLQEEAPLWQQGPVRKNGHVQDALCTKPKIATAACISKGVYKEVPERLASSRERGAECSTEGVYCTGWVWHVLQARSAEGCLQKGSGEANDEPDRQG